MAKEYEQKGSLCLRSDHMDYGRATLVSNWHHARESEPKDHDVFQKNNKTEVYDAKKRNVHQSTYNRILNITDGKLPISTCHEATEQIILRKDFEEKTLQRPMVDIKTIHETSKPRETGAPAHGFGSILPRHHVDHNKRYLGTTYGIDYKDIYPYKEKKIEADPGKETDQSFAYRKCRSQFTDIDGYRREGRNTWLDESGQYANREIKEEVFKKTNPIPERL